LSATSQVLRFDLRLLRIAIDAKTSIRSRIGMLSDPQRAYIRNVARTLQIIVGAMAAGVLFFVAIVVFALPNAAQARAADSQPLITYVAVGMSVAIGAAWLVVPSAVVRRMRETLVSGSSKEWGIVKHMPNADQIGDAIPLAAIYQTGMIIRVALLEGTAFLAAVAYMLERQPIALILVGVLWLMIVSHIPTVSRVESWVDSELASLPQLRQMR
jgi:hypothetical protein